MAFRALPLLRTCFELTLVGVWFMTLLAIVSELAFVHIFVAWHAILRQPEKGFRDIFHLDERALLGNHVGRRVALLTSKAGMLSFQDVTRQPVIKLFL